jgi:hypothetical protein
MSSQFTSEWLRAHELRTKHRQAEAARATPIVERSPEHALPRTAPVKAKNTERILVRVTSVRNRLLDEDNLCEKYVVDCCRYAGLIPSDAPDKTKIEVTQRKCEAGETEHVLIEIISQ